MHKIKLVVYYLFIQYFPHSRLSKFSGKMRLYYVAKFLNIIPYHPDSKFENNIYISDAKKLKIGKKVRINEHVFLQGKIRIGDHVMIAPYVSIYSDTHRHNNVDIPMLNQHNTGVQEVIIENDVWIGRNVVILPGVRISQGSIIGANAVVIRDVPPYSVMGGVPAKLIKSRK